MIGEVLANKKKIQLSITQQVSRYVEQYFEEIQTWDDEFLKSYFVYTRDTYMKLLNNNEDGRYNAQINELIQEMILISSNSVNNIEFSIELSKKNQHYLLEALEGIQCYIENQKAESYKKLYSFISKRDNHINHYLINRILGILSYEREKYRDAIAFLTIAIQKKPLQYELYHYLYKCYEKEGMVKEQARIENLLMLIKGDFNGSN